MTVLVSDSFNRADNSTSLGSTDSYNGGTSKAWQSLLGTWGISSNQAKKMSTGTALVIVSSGVSDGIIETDHIYTDISTNYHDGGLAFRASDSNNFWTFRLNSNTGNAELYKFVNGSGTLIQSSALSIPSNTNYHYKVVLNGTSIQCYINGTLYFSTTDSFNQSVASHGLRQYQSNNEYYDNFQISNSSSGTTYIGSGTATGQSNLTSNETLILSSSGSIQGQSSLSSTEHLIFSASGTATGKSNLTSSETLIGATGTTYSASGTVSGQSNLTSVEKLILSASGSVQGQSSLTSQEHSILFASGTVQCQSSLQSNETLIQHTGTTYSASGTVQGKSSLTSLETMSLSSGGTVQGESNLTSNETVRYFVTGIAQGHSNLTSRETFISVERIISVKTLQGDRKLYVTLEGNRVLYITLKGGVDVTAEMQNESIYAGADYILDIPNITDNANVLDLTTCQSIWFIAKRGSNQIYKDLTDGVKVVSATDIQVSLKPVDTEGLYGGYRFEIRCTDSQEFESILTDGTLTIKNSLVKN